MKKRLKKQLVCLLASSAVLFIASGMSVKAEELKDENQYRHETFYVMDEDGNLTEMESGPAFVEESETSVYSRAAKVKVVNFRTKGSTQNTNYKEYKTNESGYTNGQYGADAAYIKEEDGKVMFMLAGVVGLVNKSEVQLVNFDDAKMVSYYFVESGKLKHRIAHDMTKTSSYSTLVNGNAPSYLKKNVKYYSYDGHYFYKDYAVMVEDYKEEVRTNAENPDEPYYNYYQFLPLRSRTEYTAEELYSLLNDKIKTMGYADTSKLYKKGKYFVQNQYYYGVNALLMLGIGCNESGYGTSSICKNKNNLFGLNAVDASPSQSANTFESVEACIKEFANHWMSKGYLSPDDWRYYGGFLGNKANGINLKYASDPYWGEKAANIAYTLDNAGDNKDYGVYTIGVKGKLPTDHVSVKIRKGSKTDTDILYETGKGSGYTVLIQKSEQKDDFYKIQSDAVLNSDRTKEDTSTGRYNYAKMYAYISSKYVDIVHKGNDITLSSLSSPENVSAKYTDGKVTFKWKKVEEAQGYYVYRKVNDGSYKRIKVISSGDTLTYKDSDVEGGNTYTYTVRAYYKSIWSAYRTAGISVTIGDDEVKEKTYTKYRTTTKVNYRNGAGTSYEKKGELAEGTVISVEDGYSKTANGYTWVRFKQDGKNYYVAKEYLEKVISLSKPVLVSAKHSDGVVTFKWKKVTNAKGYYVYRKISGGSYKKIATVKSGSTVSYKDKNVTKGKTYLYTVKAYNGDNVSKYDSDGVKVKVPADKTYTKYKVTTDVNYRSGAGTDYAKKGTLKKNTVISVEDGYSKTVDGYTWVRFKMDGKNYYVAKKYITKK